MKAIQLLHAATSRGSQGYFLAPPGLPSEADRVAPLTLQITQRRDEAPQQAITCTLSRTAHGVHLSPIAGREWLFERNPRDRNRVSAFMIDHASRTIVMHAESDLRMLMGIRGWADVLLLGFELELLHRYHVTGESRTIDGLRFVRYATADTGLRQELWWSQEHLLALEFTSTNQPGSTRSSITAARAGVDSVVFRSPESRLPTYRVINVADWLEHR